MNRPEMLTAQFLRGLEQQGFPVEDITSDMTRARDRKLNPIRVLRNWTGFSNNIMREGLFNEDRDIIVPKIGEAILETLEPWRGTKTDEDLPKVTVKEISRMTRLSPEKVVSVLFKYPLSFSVNGSSFITAIQKPEFPNRRLTLSESSEYGLSPSRVLRIARYQSKKPGGGPVQKSGIQDKSVDSVIRKKAWEEQEIVFNQLLPEDQKTTDYGVMTELEVTIQDKGKTIEEIIYAEPDGVKIMKVFERLKEIGFGKNWVYRNNEADFAENLVRLSRGEPIDFLIWNCIGFKWFEDPKGEMPTCNINNNLDAAITPFFKKRIQEVASILATIGNPVFTILIPSNEAFDGRVWKYRQSCEKREQVINEAVAGLADSFRSLQLPPNARLNVTRWDNYLKLKGAEKTPEDYSREGENRVRQSANFKKIIREATKNGRGYFAQNGIGNIRDEVFLDRQIMYYGVYAGEGVAFEEFQNKGMGVVVVNFEEMRVAQMAFLGSKGSLSIVTPIKSGGMVNYYHWEARRIQKRQ